VAESATAERRWDDSRIVARTKGVPQGSIIGPVLANLNLHYCMDIWLEREFPSCRFERYAGDATIHCHRLNDALVLKAAPERRMEACGLQLHPEKKNIVYCKDSNRTAKGLPKPSFDFWVILSDRDWPKIANAVSGSPIGCQQQVTDPCGR